MAVIRDNPSKEKIMKVVRNALLDKLEYNFNGIETQSTLFKIKADEDLSIVFAENFMSGGGVLFYCETEQEFIDKISQLVFQQEIDKLSCCSQSLLNYLLSIGVDRVELASLETTPDVAVIITENLLAWNGSFVFTSNQGWGERIDIIPKNLITIAFTSQIVADYNQSIQQMKLRNQDEPPSLTTLFKYEKKPNDEIENVYLFLIEDQ